MFNWLKNRKKFFGFYCEFFGATSLVVSEDKNLVKTVQQKVFQDKKIGACVTKVFRARKNLLKKYAQILHWI